MAGSNPVYRGLVALVALNVLVAGRREDLRRRPLLLSLLLAVGAAALFNTLLAHAGAHVLARLPEYLPVFGGPLTLEGMAYGAGVGLGIAAAVLAVAPLSLCLEPDELVGALPRPLHRTGAALGAAFNLVPGLARSVVAIAEAQRLRGLPGGLATARWVLVPATLTALDDSLQLAESMESRGYGSGPRTSYAASAWRPADLLVATLSPIVAAVFVGAHVTRHIGDWYPYPALSAPPVSIGAAALCLLLLLPALLWRSQTSKG